MHSHLDVLNLLKEVAPNELDLVFHLFVQR